ncbi:MAG: formate dehydrogenase-N subunit alpha [Halomonas sp.]|nr:MAG: formate dehydrogenase-N subunit alpha [Halomonas sp.]
MTNHWVDIRNADLIIGMGGNPAEAHPVGFRWVMEAKEHNDARLVVVDPRFTRTAAVADFFAEIRTGTDIAFLGGLISYLIENDHIHHEYVRAYTDASLIVREEFGFEDGLFTGYDAENGEYEMGSWQYEYDEEGHALRDDTLQHPRCVFQLMREHFSRYSLDVVSSVCGTPRDKIQRVWDMAAETARPEKTMTFLYALGWTQHSIGSQIIRTAAIVQLLLGNMGMRGGGVNALRGHSNIQGLTDLGLLSDQLPGYLTLADNDEQEYEQFILDRARPPLVPDEVSYWRHYERFHVSLMKAWFGDAATAENDWCYHWLPKMGEDLYDILHTFERMSHGEINGYFCQGFNALAAFPHKAKVTASLSRLKYLVVIDPLSTETAEFWRNQGEYHDVNPEEIGTEVFRLPTTSFAEEDGSIVNSSRWLQWFWQAAPPPGEARPDAAILAGLFLRLQRLYREEGGAFPDPILNLHWPYRRPDDPSPHELAREYNGWALEDVVDPERNITVRAGEQLEDFGMLRADGSTACGCWVFAGCWTEQGNQMARRDNSDPYGTGQTLGWAWAWPANRRILYNRASARPDGTPWAEHKAVVWWDGQRWVGNDVPDFPEDSTPGANQGPFVMNQTGRGQLFARDRMNEGPFPEHYEPFETPIANNPMHPNSPLAKNNPAARVFEQDRENFGSFEEFPHAATSYRLTEHFHYWTMHNRLNAIAQPEKFVEIGETLAQELGIVKGDRVRVSSKRGHIDAVAVVTKRIRPLQVAGQTVHQVGIPLHWGFMGETKKAHLTNTLTPSVGDANTQTPEYKSFLVRVDKL